MRWRELGLLPAARWNNLRGFKIEAARQGNQSSRRFGRIGSQVFVAWKSGKKDQELINTPLSRRPIRQATPPAMKR
jgi:hypothetical protein